MKFEKSYLGAIPILKRYLGNTTVFGNTITYSIDEPILYYKLDNVGSSTIVDEIGVNIGGGITASNQVAVGKINGGFEYVTASSLGISTLNKSSTFDESTPWTLNMWINPVTGGGLDQYILDSESTTGTVRGAKIYVDASGDYHLWYSNDATSATKRIVISSTALPFNLGSWQMLTFTYNGNGLASGFNFYHNGVLYPTLDSGDTLNGLTTDSGRTGGKFATSLNNLFGDWQGKMDEIGLWDLALNRFKIEQLYNSGSGLSHPF